MVLMQLPASLILINTGKPIIPFIQFDIWSCVSLPFVLHVHSKTSIFVAPLITEPIWIPSNRSKAILGNIMHAKYLSTWPIFTISNMGNSLVMTFFASLSRGHLQDYKGRLQLWPLKKPYFRKVTKNCIDILFTLTHTTLELCVRQIYFDGLAYKRQLLWEHMQLCKLLNTPELH